MAHQVFLCAIFVTSFVLSSAKIPDFIHTCERDQDTISRCVWNAIEKLRPQLRAGIPELNVPGIEPLVIEELPIEQGNIVRFKAIGHDVRVYGASNFKIKRLHVDLDNLSIKADVFFPVLRFDGKYELDGRLMVVPLSGKGDIIANASNCDAEMILRGKLVIRDDKQYLHFSRMEVNIVVQDYSLELTNLFNGDQALGMVANRFINDNKADFLRSSKPFVEKTAAGHLRKLANKVMDSATFDELIPLSKSRK